jgi:uncharacterized protein (TIGR02687 family)
MSDLNQINTALERLFHEEGQRIVFWNDPDQEFQSTLPFVLLDGVQVMRLDQVGALEAKIRIEREEPDTRFLLYSPTEEPDFEDDWLLDIRLYARSFRADRASLLLDELGLTRQHLRQHLFDRRKFCDNKERLKKLQGFVAADDTEADLDRKMITVVVKADQPEWFTIFRTLFHAFTETEPGQEFDLDVPPPSWEQVEKFDLDTPFWQAAKTLFGYSEEIPSLRNLLIRMFVTDFAHHLKGDVPVAFQNLILPTSGRRNVIVCLAQWRDSASRGSSYDKIAADIARRIKLEEHLHSRELDALIDVMTFFDVEKAIVRSLRDRVTSTAETINADEVRVIASRRQGGHWASPTSVGWSEIPRRALHAAYDALVAAADFYTIRNLYSGGFDFESAPALYHAYVTELYHFDQLYRQVCEFADHAEAQGWGLLKPLREAIEAVYTHWYLPKLSLAWGQFVGPLLAKWQVEGVPNQQGFFEKFVRPRLEEADRRRVFVIISDGFRYEAAHELARELNGKYRFQAELSTQLSVLPSYTALGMAALLPHKSLGYKPDAGDVLVDGMPTSSLVQRNEVLAREEGLAVKADELLALKKEEGRDLVRPKQVVYIYHNTIDATGDEAKTEKETFQAVRRAIDEVASIVGYVMNNLNGTYILVTADHGFLFTESPPSEPEKSHLDEKPEEAVILNKRYILGRHLPHPEGVWHGSTAKTASATGDMEFLIPRGVNRYHFVGGARYFHGGTMPQEVVVPVITVKQIKGKAAEETKVKAVAVHVLGANHRITTNRYRFELLQMEPVSDRVKPATLKVAVYEADEPVTNIEAVKFDSTSGNMDERKKTVNLVLRDRMYNKSTPYRLVLRDAETGIEQQSVPVVIDRAFHDDF